MENFVQPYASTLKGRKFLKLPQRENNPIFIFEK